MLKDLLFSAQFISFSFNNLFTDTKIMQMMISIYIRNLGKMSDGWEGGAKFHVFITTYRPRPSPSVKKAVWVSTDFYAKVTRGRITNEVTSDTSSKSHPFYHALLGAWHCNLRASPTLAGW